MANDSEKGKVIAKIVKLFLEFLIAAVVAWFGASCIRTSKSFQKRCLAISKTEISQGALHRASSPTCLKIY